MNGRATEKEQYVERSLARNETAKKGRPEEEVNGCCVFCSTIMSVSNNVIK